MKVYLVQATILASIFISVIKAADEPCTNAYDQTNPINKQRNDQVMTTALLLCEQGGDDLIIDNLSIYNDLVGNVKDRFCSQFQNTTTTDNSESGVCSSGKKYNFPTYGEHFDTFVSNMKLDFDRLIPSTPKNFDSEGLTQDQIKAYMFLCTQIQLDKYKRILNQTSSDSDKEKALEEMANLGLLTHFIHSNEGKNFLADPKYPLTLRINAYKLYLENVGNNRDKAIEELDYIKYNLTELGDPEELMDFEKVDLEMSRVAMQAIKEYMERPTEKQDKAVITLLVQAKVEGAEEVIARHQTQNSSKYPNCSEISLDSYNKDSYNRTQYLLDEALNEFLNSETRIDFPQKNSFEDRWQWYQSFFSREDSSDWFLLEEKLKYGPNGNQDLLSLRQHYCFYQNLNSDIKRLEELSSNREDISNLANEIFAKINNLDASKEFLSLIKKLYPHLSNENKIVAIQSVRFNVKTSNPNDQNRLSEWRLNTLKEWFTPFSDDYSSPIAKEIIGAISFRGSIEEEKFLSELFIKAKNQSDKNLILTQYSFNSLLEETNGRPEILNAIAQEKNEDSRNQYLATLVEAFSKVQVYGASKGGFATDQIGKVSDERMREALRQMIAMSSNSEVTSSLHKQVYRTIEEAGGVLPDDSELGFGKPIVNAVPTNGTTTIVNDTSSNLNGPVLIKNKTGSKPRSGNKEDHLLIKESMVNSYSGQYKKKDLGPYQQANFGQGQRPSEDGSILSSNQNSFLNSVNQALGLSPYGQMIDGIGMPVAPVVPPQIVGESAIQKPSNDSFESALPRKFDPVQTTSNSDPSESVASNDSPSPSAPSRSKRRSNNQDIIDEIRKISRDTNNLKREIDELNGPTDPLFQPSNQVAQNNLNGASQIPDNFDANNNLGNSPQGSQPQGRNIASSNQGSSQQAQQRGNSPSDQVGQNAPDQPNPFSQGLLAPFDDPSREDLNKVIKVTSQEEKILLMNYMAANEEMSCPELRFIKEFYDQNVNKFMMGKSQREYALLELDGMNFRFNYPGTGSLRVKIQETCATLAEEQGKKKVGQGSRAPASLSAEIEEENAGQKDLVPKEVKPATEPQTLMKKFMLKLGL